jgi:hypothetical protein
MFGCGFAVLNVIISFPGIRPSKLCDETCIEQLKAFGPVADLVFDCAGLLMMK